MGWSTEENLGESKFTTCALENITVRTQDLSGDREVSSEVKFLILSSIFCGITPTLNYST